MIINSKTVFKISLFGWELVILRYPTTKKHEKEQGIRPTGVYIKREGNFLLAVDKDGHYLHPQISLTVNDGSWIEYEGFNYVIQVYKINLMPAL